MTSVNTKVDLDPSRVIREPNLTVCSEHSLVASYPTGRTFWVNVTSREISLLHQEIDNIPPQDGHLSSAFDLRLRFDFDQRETDDWPSEVLIFAVFTDSPNTLFLLGTGLRILRTFTKHVGSLWDRGWGILAPQLG